MKRELALAATMAALAVLLGIAAPGFFAFGNLWNLASDSAGPVLAALAACAVLMAGHIDVSVGALYAVCGVICGLCARSGAPWPAVAAAVLAAGVGVGAAQGALVGALRVPSILATLASMAILRGALRWGSGGQWIQELPSSFQWYGLGQTGGQTVILGIVVLATLALAGFFVRTAAGRKVLALGEVPAAAVLLGVRPARTTGLVFMIAGALVALASLASFPRYPAVEIETGIGLELDAIAAVALGGATSVRSGRAVLRTLLGAALLRLVGATFVYLHMEPAWERALQGAILLVAVAGERVASPKEAVTHA